MTIEELEDRIKHLEKDNSRKLFLQYLIFPLILAALGYYFNRQVENAKLETQRIQIAQALLQVCLVETILKLLQLRR